MKKIIVVTSSPRKGGNSEILAGKFAEGAAFSGNAVETVAVRDVDLKFCTGCMYPPSMGRTTPVMKPAAFSLARKRVAPISSSTSPNLPIGVAAIILPVRAVGVPSAFHKSESLADCHKQVLNDLGKCDILVNGAGGNNPKAQTDNFHIYSP